MTSRRTLLHAIGAAGVAGAAGFAGCLSAPGAGPGDVLTDGGSPDGTRPSDRDRPADATRRARIVARDPAPDLPVRPRVSVADPWATGGSPPVVRVDVDNPTDSPVVVGEYRAVVFQYVSAADGSLVLLPHSERSTEGDPDRVRPDYGAVGDGCWRLNSPIAVTEEYGTVGIPAGGTLTAFVGLYATPDANGGTGTGTGAGAGADSGSGGADAGTDGDGCLPTGERRFATTYSTFPDGVGGEAAERDDWGFTLSVEAVGDGR